MPEVASAPVTTGTPTPATGTQPTTAAPEPKVTYGAPDTTAKPAEPIEGAEDGLEVESEGFGDDEFGDESDAAPETPAEEFGSDTYQQLKQALAQNPELFKKVKKAISEVTRFKGMFESPEKARETVDRIETLGGLESIESEAQEWSTVYEMFSSGDPGVIDYWAKDNPEALSKLFPHIYDRMQQQDPALWNYKAAETFMATVQQSGMSSALETLAGLDAIQKSPDAKNLINKIINTINAVNAHAEKSPQRDLSPEAKKLSDKEQKLAERENALYQQGVSARVVPIMGKVAQNALSSVLKGRKLTPDAKKGLLADLNLEYSRMAKADATFQKSAKALLSDKQDDKFLKLVQANLERTMPLAARRVWRKYTGISGISEAEAGKVRAEGQTRREAGGGGAAVQMTKTAAPRAQDVDWARMRQELGRDRADSAFSFGLKELYGGKRFYYKKGDPKGIYTF
jgi:hypothetical protein